MSDLSLLLLAIGLAASSGVAGIVVSAASPAPGNG